MHTEYEFCGETCHKVMHPEYSAYELSPHARVGCVKCHIGPGADWFVRSKMSGAYQVYATIFNLYPRPIPTPIENLRPAQETCEQCHWPQQFFSEKRRSNTYYLTDEKNTSMELEMLMKIGGGNTEAGPTSGIHWHMNINNSVYYTTTDSLRQVIPFIEVISNDGSRRIYKSSESMPSDEELAKFEKRKMDCIDCHNRPSHIYHQPTNTVNHVMGQGWIDPSLPYIKKMSIEVLETPYMTTQNALDSIRLIIESYYQQDYPTIFKEKKNAIERSIKELQKIYTRNYFPIMNVSWKRFPNNIGHLFYPGCFRCHDGKHVSDDGIVLSKDCNSCHTILAQQFQNKQQQVSLDGLPYQHPEDVGNAWMESNCNDCHSSQ